MADREKVIKGVHDARRYLEDREWVDKSVGVHIDALNDAIAMLKEQEAITIKKTKEHGFGVYGGICPKCRNWIQSAHSYCGFCGQAVKWE